MEIKISLPSVSLPDFPPALEQALLNYFAENQITITQTVMDTVVQKVQQKLETQLLEKAWEKLNERNYSAQTAIDYLKDECLHTVRTNFFADSRVQSAKETVINYFLKEFPNSTFPYLMEKITQLTSSNFSLTQQVETLQTQLRNSKDYR